MVVKIYAKVIKTQQLQGNNIIVPTSFMEDIVSSTELNQIPIFKINKARIFVSVIDYSPTDAVVECSQQIWQYIAHLLDANGFLMFTQYKSSSQGKRILIEPETINFLRVKDQMSMLNSSIGSDIRVFSKGFTFWIYSFEINDKVWFKVKEIEGINKDKNCKVITAYDNDLIVDFDCSKIIEKEEKTRFLPEIFREETNMFIQA